MPSFHRARVVRILEARRGLQRVVVDFSGSLGASAVPGDRAVVLTALTGDVAPGDDVICNTTAVELGLGTGGWHFVHWNLSRESWSEPGPDHVMKLRYTSLQFDAGTSELTVGEVPTDLGGTPVVACLLHSQAMLAAATVRHLRPESRVTYVMTDGASLPLVLSDAVATARDRGVIDATVTAGHAFGGDLEAVSVPSALVMAKHHQLADVVVVGMGPGVAGTATALGTTSVEAAAVLDAVRALGGEPVLAVRASSADPRPRHRGISHHTTSVARLTLSSPWVAAVPDEARSLPGVVCRAVSPPEPAAVMASTGLSVTTMGRDLSDDPVFFAAAVAAGAVAVDLIARR